MRRQINRTRERQMFTFDPALFLNNAELFIESSSSGNTQQALNSSWPEERHRPRAMSQREGMLRHRTQSGPPSITKQQFLVWVMAPFVREPNLNAANSRTSVAMLSPSLLEDSGTWAGRTSSQDLRARKHEFQAAITILMVHNYSDPEPVAMFLTWKNRRVPAVNGNKWTDET